ncbi:MAG: sorbosone dehydrogenase family protein [Polyangiales bacterium]
MQTILRLILAIALPTALACGDDSSATDSGPGPDAVGMDAGPGGSDAGNDAGNDAGRPDTGPENCSEMTVPGLGTELVGRFNQPVYVTAAPDDPDRLYIVEKQGRIVIWDEGDTSEFLSVGNLNTDGEQGLLGLAFHPDYATNGRFFTYSTPRDPSRNVIDEWRRSDGNPLVADGARVERLLEVNDRASNHNGGMIEFGPDGFLYAGLGDEGAGGDAYGNGQNLNTLMATMVRLDVDNAAGNFVAAGNPFASGGGEPQIWAYGVRNPWRWSFDRANGNMYIADVGQELIEEISVIEPGTSGANLGWPAYEGNDVFDDSQVGDVTNHFAPIHTYRHGDFDGPSIRGGVSITGGYVYRGSAIPGLNGFYIFSDIAVFDVAALRYCEGEASSIQRVEDLSGLAGQLASFGEDGNGELYIVYLGGEVRRIVAE